VPFKSGLTDLVDQMEEEDMSAQQDEDNPKKILPKVNVNITEKKPEQKKKRMPKNSSKFIPVDSMCTDLSMAEILEVKESDTMNVNGLESPEKAHHASTAKDERLSRKKSRKLQHNITLKRSVMSMDGT